MSLQRYTDPDLGLAWYKFTRPDSGFQHAMVTRLGGVSQPPFDTLNLGHTVGDAPEAVAENHRRLLSVFDIKPSQVVSPYQVHGAQVTLVDAQDAGTVVEDTDALITEQPGLALLLRFADCVPVIFYDPVHYVVGLAHAGWRGVAAGVVPATVKQLQQLFPTKAADLWVGIGPAIGPDHYVVGEEVVQAVQKTLPAHVQVARQDEGVWHLDLAGAVQAQLTQLGVQQVERADLCTACHGDEWYSHRAEMGRTGRFGVMAMLA